MGAFRLVGHGGWAIPRPPRGPAGYPRILTPLRAAAATADGWIALQPHRDEQWTALVLAAGLDDLAGDQRLRAPNPWRGPGVGSTPLSRAQGTKAPAAVQAYSARD